MMEEEEDIDVDVFEQTSTPVPSQEDREWEKLPHADLLSIEDADELLRWRPANVVAVIGERGGGKTTLITEIYERYLRGPFAGHRFAHSRTLLGFERKGFLARLESGGAEADTERTSKAEGLKFFHLGLASDHGARTDLLISERAGESYREARNDPTKARDFVELSKARTLVFVLDGERVALDKTRNEAFAAVRGMVRAFTDAGVVSFRAEMQMVTSKFDLLQRPGLEHAVRALAQFEERMVQANAGRFAKASCARIAARAKDNRFAPAWGVDEVLQGWLAPPASPRRVPALPNLIDEFDRFLLRRRPR